jgi:hypothetical protein
LTEQKDAFAGGAVLATPAPRLSTHPADMAERDTKLPRRGRTRNIETRQEIPIAVLSCEAAMCEPGGGCLEAQMLTRGMAGALELLPPLHSVWRLVVSVAGVEATVEIPAANGSDVFDRDQAVEIAWRRASLIAQRCVLPLAPRQSEG